MGRARLSNIQWQFLRYSAWMCSLTGFLVYILWLYHEQEGLAMFLKKKLWGIPVIFLVLIIGLAIGAIFGYVIGNLVKKRLEILVQSTMALERGNLAHRTPDLGEDEIGMMGWHLNVMAERIEEQVASLQRLSSERAAWNDKLKQATITEERQRLARELHDAVSQQLFAISMLTSAVMETIPKDPNQASQQIGIVEKMAGDAQSEMRALLLHLRPAHLEGKNLKQGIEDLLTELQTKQAMTLKWKIDEVTDLAKGIEDHLFRIIQESLSNVLRHAKANSIELSLSVIGGQVRLKIIDDGVGFNPTDPQKASSYGLRSMHERVNEIGGVLEVVSRPDKGTEIDVKVPLVRIEKRGE
jgi:NarL family two-component system sensor histidine kinase LiaS